MSEQKFDRFLICLEYLVAFFGELVDGDRV